MRRILTAKTATVSTMTVAIQTLTIESKQVTLAIFRQLPICELLAPDGTLAGIPWGRVNYFPPPCADAAGRHLHVVWQDGDLLARSCVPRMEEWDRQRARTQDVREDAMHAAAAARFKLALVGDLSASRTTFWVSNDGVRIVVQDAQGMRTSFAQTTTIYGKTSTRFQWNEWHTYLSDNEVNWYGGPSWEAKEIRDLYRDPRRLATWRQENAQDSADLDARVRAFCHGRDTEAADRQRYATHLAALEALPQLYIAV